MEHTVFDIRRPSDRKKKKDMAAADEVSDMFLGFSRDDILSLPQDALLDKISAPHPKRDSLYRDEYADNEGLRLDCLVLSKLLRAPATQHDTVVG